MIYSDRLFSIIYKEWAGGGQEDGRCGMKGMRGWLKPTVFLGTTKCLPGVPHPPRLGNPLVICAT